MADPRGGPGEVSGAGMAVTRPIPVLLVEDDEDDALLTRELLESLPGPGYAITWVDGAEAALRELRGSGHRVCLLDHRLGAETGIEVLRRARAEGVTQPVILLTGVASRELDLAAMEAGASDYLVKSEITGTSLERSLRYALAVDERRRAEAAARDLEERFAAAVRATGMVLWECGRETGEVTLGGDVAGLLGGPGPWEGSGPEGGAGRNRDLWASRIDPADRDRVQAAVAAALAGPAPLRLEYFMGRGDGTRIRVRHQGRPVLDGSGGVVGMVGLLADVTEQTDLAEQLVQAQKMEAVGRLASSVAHDVNSILTVIQMHGEFLAEDLAAGHPGREDAEAILKAGQRAAALTRRLLGLSRRTGGERGPVDLARAVTGMASMLERVLGSGVSVSVLEGPEVPWIEADGNHVEQILLNLAMNARDAMGGRGRLEISTRVDPGDHRVRLEVADDGCGMDETVRARVFEPFFTTKPAGYGTGLGLSIVYGLVKEMGGGIELATAPGQGTRFSLWFPYREPSGLLVADPGDDAATLPGGHECLLVVEDDAPLRGVIARSLERLGYRVVEAEGGEAALAAVRDRGLRPDLVLTDLRMPGAPGPQVVERLRRLVPGLPAVLMSAWFEELPGPGEGGQALPRLAKPFSARALAHLVRELLDA